MACLPYGSPEDFLSDKTETYQRLEAGYAEDFKVAASATTLMENDKSLALELPDMASSRRVSGVYGNQLAQEYPDRAHAILTRNGESYVVSVRAPKTQRTGADTLCLQFETGGGRAAAAGINKLEEADVDRFLSAFKTQFE